ncbi:hypothetical protein BKA70DRAFT_1521041 [Coprinopsis sp. MPI-PUGE-AT-0042]|nr:hypothetical protein BKA70DRAFT_1521041 [Coprinopsis sp. MPI-PUGE-AT-0042]
MGPSSLNAVQGLRLPTLKRLRLCKMKPSRYYGEPTARWCTRINEFLDRSKATLDVLSLELSDLSSPDLFTVISKIPAAKVILPNLEPFFLTSRVLADMTTPVILNLQHVVCTAGLCKDDVTWKVAFAFLKSRVGGTSSRTRANRAAPITHPYRLSVPAPTRTVAKCQELAAWKDGIAGNVRFEDEAFFEETYPVIGHCFERLLNDPKVVWKNSDRRFAWHSELYAATPTDRSLDSTSSSELSSDFEDDF